MVSLSLRRAWIEILGFLGVCGVVRSLSLRRAWIEMQTYDWDSENNWSLSLRRAWIEIAILYELVLKPVVALLTENVD